MRKLLILGVGKENVAHVTFGGPAVVLIAKTLGRSMGNGHSHLGCLDMLAVCLGLRFAAHDWMFCHATWAVVSILAVSENALVIPPITAKTRP